MAKVEAERRDLLTVVKKGAEVTELKFRCSIHGEDMHYPGEMISGCKLMEKCIDCVTELSNIRDNGDGGLFVHTQASILKPVLCLMQLKSLYGLLSREADQEYTDMKCIKHQNMILKQIVQKYLMNLY